jgi:hypothetical protein
MAGSRSFEPGVSSRVVIVLIVRLALFCLGDVAPHVYEIPPFETHTVGSRSWKSELGLRCG